MQNSSEGHKEKDGKPQLNNCYFVRIRDLNSSWHVSLVSSHQHSTTWPSCFFRSASETAIFWNITSVPQHGLSSCGRYLEVSTVMGVPQARWMVYFMENTIKYTKLDDLGRAP